MRLGNSTAIAAAQRVTLDTDVGSKARHSSETVSGEMAVWASRVSGV